MNEIQQKKPDISIVDNRFMHYTSITKDVADRIREATWEEIKTVNDPGFQVIAKVIKDRQPNDKRD